MQDAKPMQNECKLKKMVDDDRHNEKQMLVKHTLLRPSSSGQDHGSSNKDTVADMQSHEKRIIRWALLSYN